MMEKAWEELDNKVIACKEFEDRNRGQFQQIITDIARLGQQIADLSTAITETDAAMANVTDYVFSDSESERNFSTF